MFGWKSALKTRLSTLVTSGLVQAVYMWDELPGGMMQMPALVVTTKNGSQSYGLSAPGVAIIRVQITAYMAAQLLPESYAQGVAIIAGMRNCLAGGIRLGGTCNYILPPDAPEMFWEGPGTVTYGDKTLAGVVFYVDVKEVEAFTVAG